MHKFLILILIFGGASVSYAQTYTYSSNFRSFDGVNIHYEVHGTGYPVLLVHGFISDGQSWKQTPMFTDLVAAGYKVIIPDMRGNGQSDKPQTAEAYADDAEAKDLMGLVSVMGLNYYHAIGYSRGSIIVSRLLVLDKRVTKAVLGGMGPDFTNPDWPRRKLFYQALADESVPELQGMVKRVQDAGLNQTALAYLQKEQPSTTKEQLTKIRRPVMVISGKKDKDNGSARQLAKLIPASTLATVTGDHASAKNSPMFSKKVLDFLSKRKLPKRKSADARA